MLLSLDAGGLVPTVWSQRNGQQREGAGQRLQPARNWGRGKLTGFPSSHTCSVGGKKQQAND